MKVLADYHHHDLWESLELLFARFGWTLYRPIGMEWFEQGYWNHERKWHGDAIARQYLEPWGSDALGMRFDQRFGGNRHWSPRVGLVHETANAGIFKLLYASAFRDPTVFERFYTNPTYIYGNPVLRSERMQSVEAAWEKRIGNGRLMASAYLFRLKDLIAPDADTGVVRNSGPLTGQGLELTGIRIVWAREPRTTFAKASKR